MVLIRRTRRSANPMDVPGVRILDILKEAITVAKERQITKVDELRKVLRMRGHRIQEIEDALALWATYERAKT